MKRCKHPGSARVWPFTIDEVSGLQVGLVVCGLCCEQLPLGPAADSPAALVELRAAELATALDRHKGPLVDAGFTADEVMGWVIARHDLVTPPTSSQDPGYLARIIYEHKEEKS